MNTTIGWIGYGGVILMTVIGAVILVEFDPEAHSTVNSGQPVFGYVSLQGETPVLEELDGSRYPVLRVDANQLTEGQGLSGDVLPDATGMIPDFARPHQPRDITALVLAMIGLLGTMALVGADPRVAYVDIFKSHV